MCEPHDSTGEPGAGNRPAGFGERGEETCPWESDCGPAAKAPDEPPTPLPATRLPSTLQQSGRYPYEVLSRIGAAKFGSIDQETLLNWTYRFNKESLEGLINPKTEEKAE